MVNMVTKSFSERKGSSPTFLSVGKHTVTVKFEDGEAQATVTIKEAPPVPKTGDNGNPALWIGMMVLGIVGIGGMAVSKKRSRR